MAFLPVVGFEGQREVLYRGDYNQRGYNVGIVHALCLSYTMFQLRQISLVGEVVIECFRCIV